MNTVQYPVIERRLFLHFGYEVKSTPDGGMVLTISTPAGIRYELPFDPEARQALGRDITAPSLIRP
jgi:hypothetical protein